MCFCISKDCIKTYHINNSDTNQRICDIYLKFTMRMSNIGASNMAVNVNDAVASLETDISVQNCCINETNIIGPNIPITIRFPSIPELFVQHEVQFVFDQVPFWHRPLSRMHLYIDGNNVLDPSRQINEFTQNKYAGDINLVWLLIFGMCLPFTFLYFWILSLFIGVYSWFAIEAHLILGLWTSFSIWSGVSKALCGCDDSNPSEFDIQFNPAADTGSTTTETTEAITAATAPITMELVTRNGDHDNDELPENWIKIFTADGRPYYQNNVTKQIQWDKPTM